MNLSTTIPAQMVPRNPQLKKANIKLPIVVLISSVVKVSLRRALENNLFDLERHNLSLPDKDHIIGILYYTVWSIFSKEILGKFPFYDLSHD